MMSFVGMDRYERERRGVAGRPTTAMQQGGSCRGGIWFVPEGKRKHHNIDVLTTRSPESVLLYCLFFCCSDYLSSMPG